MAVQKNADGSITVGIIEEKPKPKKKPATSKADDKKD